MALCPFYLSRICLWGFIACKPSVYLGMKRPLKVSLYVFRFHPKLQRSAKLSQPLVGQWLFHYLQANNPEE